MTTSAPPPAATGDIPARKTVSGFLIALLVVEVVAWWWLTSALNNLSDGDCLAKTSVTPGWGFVVPGLLALLIGRYTAGLRFLEVWPQQSPERRSATSAQVGLVVLAILFAALTVIFVYEAIGTYKPPNGLEPITYYVRCAVRLDLEFLGGIRTHLIIFVIGFLFGHWLWAWHPRPQFRGRLRARARDVASDLAANSANRLPQPRTINPSGPQE